MKQYDVEVESEKSKKIKPLTLISGIIGVIIGVAMVALAVFVGINLLSAVWVTDKSSAGEAFAFAFFGWLIIPVFLLICGLIMVVAILNIVSGSFAISAATKDDKKYMARKGLIITSIVFDFILVIALGIFALTTISDKSSDSGITAILVGVGAAVAFISAIIKIIDTAQVSKRYNRQVKYEKEQKKIQEEHGTENKLAKYKQMLDNGVITKEEYEKLRAKELGIDKE